METERGHVQSNGIELAYQSLGARECETVLLLPGIGGAMDEGPDLPALELVARGFRVVTYDGRDSGASTHIDGAGMPDWEAIQAALAAAELPQLSYTLEDVAADATRLPDAPGVDRAHVVGGSMGGTVAQIVAAEHPERVRSLTSISSSTGNPELARGPATAAVAAAPAESDASAIREHRTARAQRRPCPRI